MFDKIGWKALPSVQLAFGEEGDCRGWLVGQEHRGIAHMFQMMNEARLMVGLNGIASASVAYHRALHYARERPQGRPLAARDPRAPQVAVIEHADVRRMLLRQKAIVAGRLGLLLRTAMLTDLAEHAEDETARREARLLLDLLVPVAKTLPAGYGFESNTLAIQVHGGYGYTSEFLPESWWRDQKLNSIHEGTSGIQALDLLGRKAVAAGGEPLRLFARDVERDAAAAREHGMAGQADALAVALADLVARTAAVAARGVAGDTEAMLRHAADCMDAFSVLAVTRELLAQGSGDQFVTERACLGESAYGGERVVAVSTDRKPDYCSPSIEGELHIDRFDVVPAQPTECAAPGQVVNGDAETDGGWTLSDSKGGQATLAAGVGADASRGLSLTVTARCGSAAASTPVSIPVRPTALELWWRGTAGSVASLAIDDATIATLRGDGGETRLRMCAPAALLGRASHLSVSTYGDAPGFCGEPLEVGVVIDDVQLVDEPACGAQSGVVDGGFESLLQPFRAIAYASGDSVQAVAAPGLAHGGEALLELTVANRGVDPVFVQPLQVPVPTGNGEGPALRYWHNVPANPISTLYRRVGDSLIELPEGGGWVEERVCLDPDYAGRPLRFSVFLCAVGELR